jgi:hypothetical protein
VPNFDPSITGGGCDPYFHVRLLQKTGECAWKERRVFNYKKQVEKVKKCYPQERFVDLDCKDMKLKVRGDVKIVLFDQDQYQDDKMCHFWFHTAFVERNFLVFDKSVIDKATKDKHCRTFDANFKVEIYLHRVDDREFNFNAIEDEGDTKSGTDTDETDEEGKKNRGDDDDD